MSIFKEAVSRLKATTTELEILLLNDGANSHMHYFW